ncbi:P-loop containing nucleoside triphosphate hydrolase protein [Cryomyces antarcticus]
MDEAHRISITVCGDGGCGKSSITLRLVRSQWTHEYDPTIEDSYSVTRIVDGSTYHLALTDTAGQEEYRGLWATSNLRSDAFLLVYDITNASSLETLDYFMSMVDIERETRMDKGEVMPVCIVAGNKCDLQDARQVKSQQGLEWARGRKCGFMETSAREMVNIEETFALLVRRVVEARKLQASGGIPPEAPSMHTLSPSTQNEKPAVQSSTGVGGRPSSSGPQAKKGFWASLKCW